MSEVGSEIEIQNQGQFRETSRRLKRSIKTGLGFIIENPNMIPLIGKEFLKEIPPNKKLIIATTHLSDADVAVAAYALSDNFDITIVHHSTHDNPSEDAWSWVGAAIAGRKNFLSVKSRKEEGKVIADFAPEDFEPMRDALGNGKAIIIAAHNPTYDWKLSDKGGLGAIYLAQLSDALILPVSVNIESEAKSGSLVDMRKAVSKNKRKSKAKVSIGQPINLEKVNVQKMTEILKKRKEGSSLSHQERREFTEIATKLRDQSSIVMRTLAAMLPPEKRGVWGENGRI